MGSRSGKRRGEPAAARLGARSDGSARYSPPCRWICRNAAPPLPQDLRPPAFTAIFDQHSTTSGSRYGVWAWPREISTNSLTTSSFRSTSGSTGTTRRARFDPGSLDSPIAWLPTIAAWRATVAKCSTNRAITPTLPRLRPNEWSPVRRSTWRGRRSSSSTSIVERFWSCTTSKGTPSPRWPARSRSRGSTPPIPGCVWPDQFERPCKGSLAAR